MYSLTAFVERAMWQIRMWDFCFSEGRTRLVPLAMTGDYTVERFSAFRCPATSSYCPLYLSIDHADLCVDQLLTNIKIKAKFVASGWLHKGPKFQVKPHKIINMVLLYSHWIGNPLSPLVIIVV